MNAKKYTPGPWNWTSDLDEKGKLTGKQIIYDSDEKLGYRYRDIAILPSCKTKAEVRANARLIAAAPELLEALQLAYQLIPPPTLETLGAAEACANLAWIKRILDKAEGSDK